MSAPTGHVQAVASAMQGVAAVNALFAMATLAFGALLALSAYDYGTVVTEGELAAYAIAGFTIADGISTGATSVLISSASDALRRGEGRLRVRIAMVLLVLVPLVHLPIALLTCVHGLWILPLIGGVACAWQLWQVLTDDDYLEWDESNR